MPQEHYVLRCVSCETFQAHIVKKSKKWECKMCGTKQSLKKNYGKGSGKDCHIQVMKLNELRLTQQEIVGEDMNGTEEECINNYAELSNEPCSSKLEIKGNDHGNLTELANEKPFKSKWDIFMDKVEEPDEEEEALESNFTWEVNSKKRKRSKNEVMLPKKKVQNDVIAGSDANSTLLNKEKFNVSKSPETKNSFKTMSKWEKYEATDDTDDLPSGKFLGSYNDDLDKILEL